MANQLLRQGLNMAKLPISDEEYRLLTTHFAVEGKTGFSRWKDLCNLIEEKEENKLLESIDPARPLLMLSETYFYGKVPITEQQQRLAADICERFKEFARMNRLDLKEAFKGWDKLGRYKVSPKQFRQVLATFNF